MGGCDRKDVQEERKWVGAGGARTKAVHGFLGFDYWQINCPGHHIACVSRKNVSNDKSRQESVVVRTKQGQKTETQGGRRTTSKKQGSLIQDETTSSRKFADGLEPARDVPDVDV